MRFVKLAIINMDRENIYFLFSCFFFTIIIQYSKQIKFDKNLLYLRIEFEYFRTIHPFMKLIKDFNSIT
jgi:hypothetical protein